MYIPKVLESIYYAYTTHTACIAVACLAVACIAVAPQITQTNTPLKACGGACTVRF